MPYSLRYLRKRYATAYWGSGFPSIEKIYPVLSAPVSFCLDRAVSMISLAFWVNITCLSPQSVLACSLNGWLNDDAVGDVQTLFNVAPITRALYDGSPYSYTFSKKRDKSRSYIQNGIVHNYKEVKEYYNAIKALYDEYVEAKENISDMWENVK